MLAMNLQNFGLLLVLIALLPCLKGFNLKEPRSDEALAKMVKPLSAFLGTKTSQEPLNMDLVIPEDALNEWYDPVLSFFKWVGDLFPSEAERDAKKQKEMEEEEKFNIMEDKKMAETVDRLVKELLLKTKNNDIIKIAKTYTTSNLKSTTSN